MDGRTGKQKGIDAAKKIGDGGDFVAKEDGFRHVNPLQKREDKEPKRVRHAV